MTLPTEDYVSGPWENAAALWETPRSLQGEEDSYRTCRAPTETESPSFVAEPFALNLATINLHDRSPRFGHTKDITVLISGSSEEQADYLVGLLAASFSVFLLYIVWLSLLWIFSGLGPSRVGFLSGRRLVPEKPVKPGAVKKLERSQRKDAEQPRQSLQANGNMVLSSSPNNTAESEAAKRTTSDILLSPVSGVVSAARAKKREIEMRNQFSKMQSESFEVGGGSSRENPGGSSDDLAPTGNGSDAVEEETEHQRTETNPPVSSSPGMMVEHGLPETTFVEEKAIAQYHGDMKLYQVDTMRSRMRIRRVRVLAGFCGVGIFISAVLYTIMTQKEFTSSIKSFEGGLDQVNVIINSAIQAVNNFVVEQQLAFQNAAAFIENADGICPKVADSFCTGLENTEEWVCDFTEIPVIGEGLQRVVGVFNADWDTLFENLGSLEEDLVELQNDISQAELFFPEYATLFFWTSAGCSLALGVLGLILAGAMFLMEYSGSEELPLWFPRVRSWIMIPLFFCLTTFGWILSIVYVLAGMGSADLCYNSPDLPILTLLDEVKGTADPSVIYDYVRFFVSGCPAGQGPGEIREAIARILDSALTSLADLADTVANEGAQQLEETCGGDSAAVLVPLIGGLGNQLCILAVTLAGIVSLFRCTLWYPLYRLVMHEALCYELTQGLAWAIATQLVILVLSLLLLTLRVAYHELDEVLDDGTGRMACCCCCLRCCCGGPRVAAANDDSKIVPQTEVVSHVPSPKDGANPVSSHSDSDSSATYSSGGKNETTG